MLFINYKKRINIMKKTISVMLFVTNFFNYASDSEQQNSDNMQIIPNIIPFQTHDRTIYIKSDNPVEEGEWHGITFTKELENDTEHKKNTDL